jgi:hypothetical protein
MFRHSRAKRTRGQALVEFVLTATLIFMLLSAAVDLGLIFFTLQGMRTAAQEGATFGSYPLMVMSGSSVSAVDLDYANIINRVRFSSGQTSSGFANLLDLNNDGIDDGIQAGILNYTDPNAYIYIQRLRYTNDDLDQTPDLCPISQAWTGMRKGGEFCYVRVTVKYEYRFIFPLAPVFKDTITLTTSYMIHVRSDFVG